MKIRESGMPERDAWETFFEPEIILQQLELNSSCHDVVEFGCGYGTFTVPAAGRITGTIHTLDIEPAMLAMAARRAEEQGLDNIHFIERDFIGTGTGLPDGSMDYAMVFNILHYEDPVSLLREAYRNLRPGGRVGIIHWNHDPDTPRGPPMAVRPRSEDCMQWGCAAGFSPVSDIIDLPPYHYGMVLSRQ